MTINK